ncbi:two-component sensor histidine kinase [Propioniciclava sp. MC1595]|uniref:sensor histidine kinase n=1 Tax=Propioniciclava sp. MC1595 TaxID=2760308 RepID=UPI0016623798|nr:ATP-binding protein [Propioniciclava sp. MC1595]MBB1494929.1 two-component sensor histidine kinase [Propioniciclava sp. MC1595]QTE25549.1 two-component sensor histidine kinase [Propioniciclava sp. MC1595]
MSPALAALIGLVAGVFAGYLVAWFVLSRRAEPEPVDQHLERRRILDALRSGGALIGDVDDILASNELATELGLIRGNRVAIPALLDLVREVRRTGESASVNLDQVRAGRGGVGRSQQRLAVRVLRLDDGNILVVADDRGAALRVQASARDFMANATHELKTPVGAITLLSEAVEQAADDPEAVARFSRKIQAESSRLSQLVTQIVQLSRLQGEPVSNAEEVSVDEVVGLALDRSRQLAEQRQVSLTRGGEEGLVVRGKHEQLVTAVVNLVHNAITYSGEKARVVITTRAVTDGPEPRVAIAVTDNGIGIGAEDTKRIFERFYRVDYARSRQTGGTGLGLSIVAEIVEGHGGEVTVWSKLGSGSTFTITLPAAAEEEEEVA